MGGKAGKIALAIIVLAVAAYLSKRTFTDGADAGLPKDFAFVCVATGEIFELDLDDVASIPAKNPKTGQATLLPCKPDENGVVHVTTFYRGALQGKLKEANKFVDPASLEVRIEKGS